MIITGYNPPTDDLERSYLADGVSSGATNLTTQDNDRFTANSRVQIGESGAEKTEVVTLSSTSDGTGLTVSSCVFPHSANDPVYALRFDQVKFYRSITGVNGSYDYLATEALDVDNADLTTKHDDTVGLSAYYYKVSYYNSISTLESSLSDPVLGGGYPRNSVGFMIDEILREVSDEQEGFTSRTEILGWFNEVNDDLLTRSKKPFAFLHTRTPKSRTAGATTLDWPTDMWKFDRLDYVFTDTASNSTTYPVRVLGLSEFRNKYGDSSSGDANDELQVIALDDTTNVFRLWPRSKTVAGAVFYIYYWKFPTQLDSEGDLFETDTPRIYKLFALYKFYLKKAASDTSFVFISNQYDSKYEAEVTKLKRGGNKDAGSPKGFKYSPQDFKGNRRF